MPEDAKGHAEAQKAARKKIMEQKEKLRSLNKSHNYQLLEARRVSLMSELAYAAVHEAILDPSAHKTCPWSLCFREAPAAAVKLSHDPSYFHPKENPKRLQPLSPPQNSMHACKKEGASHGSSQRGGGGRKRPGHQVLPWISLQQGSDKLILLTQKPDKASRIHTFIAKINFVRGKLS